MTARRPKASTSQHKSRAIEDSPSINMKYLEGTIGYMIRRAQIAVFSDIYKAFGDIRITTAEFSVLAVVADNPGINQADLASALGVERPRMVPIINKLEERKLALRVVDRDDARARLIHLTTQGEQLLSVLKKRFAEHQRRMLVRLGAADPSSILRDLRHLAGVDGV